MATPATGGSVALLLVMLNSSGDKELEMQEIGIAIIGSRHHNLFPEIATAVVSPDQFDNEK